MEQAICRIIALVLVIYTMTDASEAAGVTRDPDSFTDTVAKALNATGLPDPVHIVSPLTLTVRSGDGADAQINLDRIYRACQADEPHCLTVMSQFVTGISDTLKSANAPPAPADLRAVVRPAQYIRENPVFAKAVKVRQTLLPESLVV